MSIEMEESIYENITQQIKNANNRGERRVEALVPKKYSQTIFNQLTAYGTFVCKLNHPKLIQNDILIVEWSRDEDFALCREEK